MPEASSNADTTPASTELVLALTTKKKARATTTRKKTATKTTTKKAATAKKSTSKKTTTQKAAAKKRTTKKSSSPTTRKRATTTSAKRATASLKTDLKKLTDESYTAGDFTRGALVLVQGEGVEILRNALMVMLSSKTPLIGGVVSGVALETLLDKVTDTYKAATVADRKALRAVINWLRGDANTDEETQQNLVALLNGQEQSPAGISSVIPEAILGATDFILKTLRR